MLTDDRALMGIRADTLFTIGLAAPRWWLLCGPMHPLDDAIVICTGGRAGRVR